MVKRFLFVCFLGDVAACLHTDENNPIRGEKLMKKGKAGKISGVKAIGVREESVLMHREGMACS